MPANSNNKKKSKPKTASKADSSLLEELKAIRDALAELRKEVQDIKDRQPVLPRPVVPKNPCPPYVPPPEILPCPCPWEDGNNPPWKLPERPYPRPRCPDIRWQDTHKVPMPPEDVHFWSCFLGR